MFIFSLVVSFIWSDQELESLLFDENKPFITCDTAGQIGNALFRSAAGISRALDLGYSFFLPIEYKKKYFIIFSKIKSLPPNKKIRRDRRLKVCKSIGFKVIPGLRIKGYPHTYLYFDHHKEEIRSLFAPPEDLKRELYSRFHNLLTNQQKYVGLHIRTFVQFEDLKILRLVKSEQERYAHLPCTYHYYDQAINYFGKDVTYVVFSDNIEIAKKVLKKRYDCDFIFIEKTKGHEDFYLMSFFDKLIISNSTFAWWSAYLNSNPNKKIVTPWPWYRGKDRWEINGRHIICPPDWVEFDQGEDIYELTRVINTLI